MTLLLVDVFTIIDARLYSLVMTKGAVHGWFCEAFMAGIFLFLLLSD